MWSSQKRFDAPASVREEVQGELSETDMKFVKGNPQRKRGRVYFRLPFSTLGYGK